MEVRSWLKTLQGKVWKVYNVSNELRMDIILCATSNTKSRITADALRKDKNVIVQFYFKITDEYKTSEILMQGECWTKVKYSKPLLR